MKGLKRSTLPIFLLLFVTIFFSPLPVLAIPIVSIQPPVSAPNLGSVFDVHVDISGVTDLYAFQFDISFDPAIISATNIQEGSFLRSGGDTFPFSIDNTAGSITSITFVDTLLTSIPGVNGDGTLVDVTFQALALGTSSIVLSNLIFSDSNVLDISTTAQSGSVNVASGISVPEPATLLLISMGMVALGILRKKGLGII